MKSGPRNLIKFFLLLAILCMPRVSTALDVNNYVEGEALVVLRNNIGTLNATSLNHTAAINYIGGVAGSASAEVVTTYSELSAAGGEIFALIRSETKSTEELIAELEINPNVVSASPNYIMYAAVKEPNDTHWDKMWNMKSIRAHEAWDISTGNSNVYVAVLDSGIDAGHEDLKDNIDRVHSRNFVPGDSGLVDDKDYDDKSRSGHGTHIAGIAAATGNNKKGVAGVAWNAKLIVLRIMDADNMASHAWTIAGIDYLVGLLRDNPDMKVAAANLSIAGWRSLSPSDAKEEPLWIALDKLDKLNRTVIVVAAGNDYSQIGEPAIFDYSGTYEKGQYCYPASYIGLNNMIVVAGTYHNSASITSNWSAVSVHLAAPGVGVYSTLPGSSYGLRDGTSKAAPHVAGAAALVASANPDLTASKIREILLQSANPGINPEAPVSVEIDNEWVTINPQRISTKRLSRYGLLNVGKAVALAAGVPYHPTEPNTPKSDGGGGCNAGIAVGVLIIVFALCNTRRFRS